MTDLRLTYQDGKEDLKPGDAVLQIFQNENYKVIKYTVRRGGCLYAGNIRLFNKSTNKSFELDSTSSPYCPNHPLSVDNDKSCLDYLLSLAKRHIG